MSGATNAPGTACGHPGFCEPGSAECIRRALADDMRALGVEVPMHPTNRDLARLTETLGGRPMYVDGGDLARTDGGKLRVLPTELVELLVADVRAEADARAGSVNRAAPNHGDAVADWLDTRPGFSRLLHLTIGTPPSKDH